ncbi:DUF2956 domain-containing protein [Pelagibaculum spongiae]|uniref:DUF2956 domain-containing protein n=1 Tax=Pelagibaculum spongiae TaxID=2080658 RepID=A0A2V1H1V7_9GAMM|nr:DUF2956 domain-containing protein [Pelagibaculum spongiae]PVZ70422.1 DUF2956 domain-containing protein [Pelagibaculum spongiae]
MARYSKNQQAPSPETIKEAHSMAKAVQKPGQTKEQTRLVAQGIQKGIEEYKKRNKAKARELDKRLRQAKQPVATAEVAENDNSPIETAAQYQPNWLPWLLLAASWIGFAVWAFPGLFSGQA